jgi:hypothetical protein
MARQRLLVELEAPQPVPPPGASRDQKIAELRRIAQEAKSRVIPLLESCRRIDPGMDVSMRDNLFPVLTIVTTDQVVEKLRESGLVKRVEPAPDFQIGDSMSADSHPK